MIRLVLSSLVLAQQAAFLVVAEDQKVQKFDDLFQFDNRQDSLSDSVRTGNIRGVSADRKSSGDHLASENDDVAHHEHKVNAEPPSIEVPPCADHIGATPIRINGDFVECSKLLAYCNIYQQVKDVCPVTCGLCEDTQDNLQEEEAAEGNAQEEEETKERDADVPPSVTTTTTVIDKSADDDMQLTPEEHVVALKLLLRKISMENEHLRLSLSECKAENLDLQLRVLDKHSSARTDNVTAPPLP